MMPLEALTAIKQVEWLENSKGAHERKHLTRQFVKTRRGGSTR